MLLLPGTAGADETTPRIVLASVEQAARVVPEPADASPCPDAVPIDPQAARLLVARLAATENVLPEFALAVAKIESRYASAAVSAKGAFGLMQLTPDTARRFAVDLCDPEGNVRGGLRYLRFLQDRYRNPLTVLDAYNAGEAAVRRARGVPAFPETVRFVADVLNELNAWPPAGMAATDAAGSPEPIEAADRDPAESRRTEPASPAPWSAGFVMHVQ